MGPLARVPGSGRTQPITSSGGTGLPVYLVPGVYLPDESSVRTRDLYASAPTRAVTAELRDASAAVHGTLRRAAVRGRAHGTWTADVSPPGGRLARRRGVGPRRHGSVRPAQRRSTAAGTSQRRGGVELGEQRVDLCGRTCRRPLVEGAWDTGSPAQDSRSTWHLSGDLLELRLPWSMLALGDPSSRTAVLPDDGLPQAAAVAAVGVVLDAGPGGRAAGQLRWEGWQQAFATERLKPGVQPLVDTWAALGEPAG